MQLLSIIVPLMPNIRHTPCGRRLEAKIADYESKGLMPALSHSLSASSINSPDLGSESDGTMGEFVATPSPSQKMTAKKNPAGTNSNVALRRVATSPESQDEAQVVTMLFP